MNRTCRKCNIEKPKTKEYFRFTYKQINQGEKVLFLEYTCKECEPRRCTTLGTLETLDGMISFAQSLGFKSASYAIDKYGKEQFKQMYYDNR